MKQKLYVVFVGHKPGVYRTWADCYRQVEGYPNNFHNSYRSHHEAEQALAEFQCKNRKINEVKGMKDEAMVDKAEDDINGVKGMKEPNKVHVFSLKDLGIFVLITLVVFQAYLLYHK